MDPEGLEKTIEAWIKPETGYRNVQAVRAAAKDKYVDSVLYQNPQPGPFWTNQTSIVCYTLAFPGS